MTLNLRVTKTQRWEDPEEGHLRHSWEEKRKDLSTEGNCPLFIMLQWQTPRPHLRQTATWGRRGFVSAYISRWVHDSGRSQTHIGTWGRNHGEMRLAGLLTDLANLLLCAWTTAQGIMVYSLIPINNLWSSSAHRATGHLTWAILQLKLLSQVNWGCVKLTEKAK